MTMIRFALLNLLLANFYHHVLSFGVQRGRVFVSTPAAKFPKTVGECMSPVAFVVHPSTSVDECITKLLENGLTGAPVVNDNNDLVGIVSSTDFLQKEAFEGALLMMEGTVENVEKNLVAAKKICGSSVEDVMTTDIVTIDASATMREAAALMASKDLHQLPVVTGGGNFVGMLSSADVMRDLIHAVKNLPPAKQDQEQRELTP